MKIETLTGKHKGETAYIIGSGKSIQHLNESYFGNGIIIALNDNILRIESLQIPHIIYSMQKDNPGGHDRFECKCTGEQICIFGELVKVIPKRAILLVHELESNNCMTEYPNRYTFNNERFGYKWNKPSVFSSVKVAQLLGCSHIKLVSFDATALNCNGRILKDGRLLKDHPYHENNEGLVEMLKIISHEFVTPK